MHIKNQEQALHNSNIFTKIFTKPNGITLIALVITIIVLLILAGVTINRLFSDGGILGKTEEVKFKTRMAELNEKTELFMVNYVIESEIENNGIIQRSKVNAGALLETMLSSKNSPLGSDFTSDKITHELNKIIKIKSDEEKYLVVYEGELCYVSQNSVPNNEQQEQCCRELGIRILEFKESQGIEKTNGDYENINGLYMCTPDLTKFTKLKTRYLKLNEAGNLTTTTTFTSLSPEPDWYDYKNSKWANIYVESEGNSAYYVWIPRYAYKPSEGNVTGSERADVIFIDTENNYKYIDAAGQEQTKTWEELEAENYIIPDAFGWGDDDSDRIKNTQISGYWMSKYALGEISTLPVQYDFGTEKEGVLISNIVTNITNIKNTAGEAVTIGKYEFAMNGRVTDVFTSKPTTYTFTTGMRKGMNTFTVTLLDQNDEIIGSMTKEFEVTEANAPEIEQFDKQNTYYVTYGENENEHSTIPLTEPPPTDWYAYETRQWANIVVRQNGAETYYTWIPRYAYKTSGERATVRFLKGTSSDIPEGYIIPDAFGWGDDDNNRTQNTQLTGYWITKYVLGESNTLDVNTEYTTTSGTITTQGLTGTGIVTGQKYFYWINGKFIKETTNSAEKITYSGLETGKTYTILIEIRDSTNALVGTITKEATTTTANAPILEGFDNDETDGDNTMTYYVTYGEDGNGAEDSSRPITQSPPENWYDYSEKRWANIVVRKTNADGSIISETYYTWIPRYAYREVIDKQRVDVIFLPETGSDIPPDYILPDAFAWGDDDTNATNNTPIKGYWITKYVLGE